MIDDEKLFFINTPVDIQDEIYYKTIEYLNEIDIEYNSYIYLVFTPIANNIGKFYFKGYIKNEPILTKNFDNKSDFIIFYS